MKPPRITPPKLTPPRLTPPRLKRPTLPTLDWRKALSAPAAVSSTLSDSLISGVGGAFDTGFGLLRDTIGGVPFFGTTASSELYDHSKIDEKHYFLIPDDRTEDGFSLLVTRCLPAGVPPINDLPKRRLLHLPSREALPMLEHILLREARERAQVETVPSNAFSNNLNAMIDEIDSVDSKVFAGLLTVGGLVALANPLAGAALAAHAIIPSVGLIAARYGLRAASRTATNLELSREIKRAEKEVTTQFRSSETFSLLNPVLHHVSAPAPLDMWMVEGERFAFETDATEFGDDDIRRLVELTLQALADCGVEERALAHALEVAEIVSGGRDA